MFHAPYSPSSRAARTLPGMETSQTELRMDVRPVQTLEVCLT
jgi:hypothetical protein